MKLHTYLAPPRVAVLDAGTKENAIAALLKLFAGHPSIADHGALADAIWEREEALPTGIGLGIGVPHVRLTSVRAPVAALGVLKTGIDYSSLDGIPVRVLLMVAMPAGMHKEYLQYLARASRLFQDETFRDELQACRTADALWEVVRER